MNNLVINSEIDIVGIVKEDPKSEEINLKTGETKVKTNVTIYDDSMIAVDIVFWG